MRTLPRAPRYDPRECVYLGVRDAGAGRALFRYDADLDQLVEVAERARACGYCSS